VIIYFPDATRKLNRPSISIISADTSFLFVSIFTVEITGFVKDQKLIHPMFSPHAYPESVPLEVFETLKFLLIHEYPDVLSVQLTTIHPTPSPHAYPRRSVPVTVIQ
jgi:hypothetical protein